MSTDSKAKPSSKGTPLQPSKAQREAAFYYDMLRAKPSAAFASKSPRIAPIRDNGVPGPGKHTPDPQIVSASTSSPSSVKRKPSAAFASVTPRFAPSLATSKSDSPDNDDKKDTPSGKGQTSKDKTKSPLHFSDSSPMSSKPMRPTSAFSSGSPRLGKLSKDGPDTFYDLPSSFSSKKKKMSGVFKYMSPRLTKPRRSAGADAIYDIPSSFGHTKSTKSRSPCAFGTSSPRMSGLKATTGWTDPGSVDIPSSFGRVKVNPASCFRSSTPKLEKTKRVPEGQTPGKYDPRIDFLSRSSRAKK